MKLRVLNARVAGVVEALVTVTTAIFVTIFFWVMVAYPDTGFAKTVGGNSVESVWNGV